MARVTMSSFNSKYLLTVLAAALLILVLFSPSFARAVLTESTYRSAGDYCKAITPPPKPLTNAWCRPTLLMTAIEWIKSGGDFHQTPIS